MNDTRQLLYAALPALTFEAFLALTPLQRGRLDDEVVYQMTQKMGFGMSLYGSIPLPIPPTLPTVSTGKDEARVNMDEEIATGLERRARVETVVIETRELRVLKEYQSISDSIRGRTSGYLHSLSIRLEACFDSIRRRNQLSPELNKLLTLYKNLVANESKTDRDSKSILSRIETDITACERGVRIPSFFDQAAVDAHSLFSKRPRPVV